MGIEILQGIPYVLVLCSINLAQLAVDGHNDPREHKEDPHNRLLHDRHDILHVLLPRPLEINPPPVGHCPTTHTIPWSMVCE